MKLNRAGFAWRAAFVAVILAPASAFAVGGPNSNLPAPTTEGVTPPVAAPAPMTPDQLSIGAKTFGAWQLICAPSEPSAGEQHAMPDGPSGTRRYFCSINHQVVVESKAQTPSTRGTTGVAAALLGGEPAGREKRIIAMVKLALTGEAGNGLMQLHLPPVAKAGDHVELEVSGAASVSAKIVRCDAGQCIAQAAIGAETLALWHDAKMLKILFPPVNGKSRSINVAFDGFADALDALKALRTPDHAP